MLRETAPPFSQSCVNLLPSSTNSTLCEVHHLNATPPPQCCANQQPTTTALPSTSRNQKPQEIKKGCCYIEAGGSSSAAGNKTNTRRVWTKVEEDALLNLLDEVVATGDRADNDTFKSRVYKCIENELAQLLP